MLLTKSPSPKKYIISQMLSELHFSLLEIKICSYMTTSTKSSSNMYIFLWGTVRLFSETSCRDRSNTSNQSLIATRKAWVSENSLLKYTRHCFICFFKGEKKNPLFFRREAFPFYFTAQESLRWRYREETDLWFGTGGSVDRQAFSKALAAPSWLSHLKDREVEFVSFEVQLSLISSKMWHSGYKYFII